MGTPFEASAVAQAATPSENNTLPPAKISFYNILNSSHGQANSNQDHFREELRKMQLNGLAPTDGAASSRATPEQNQSFQTSPKLNPQPDADQKFASPPTNPVANPDSTPIIAGSSTDLPRVDSSRVTYTPPSPFMDELSSWSIHNLYAGAIGASSVRLFSHGAPLGRTFCDAVGVSALMGAADMGLDHLFPSVGGHRLFKPTMLETVGAGVTVALPIKDVKVKAGILGAYWLGGRIYNYFEN